MKINGFESLRSQNLMSVKQLEKDNLVNKNHNKKIIEKFVNFGGDNSTTNIDETKVRNLTEKTQNITNDMVVNSVSNLLTESINEAMMSNKAEVVKMLNAANEINMSGIKTGGDFVISNTTQSSTVKSQVNGEIIQDLTSKIKTEINKNIKKNFEQKITNIDKLKDVKQASTNVGDVINGAIDSVAGLGSDMANAAASTVKDVFSMSCGGDSSSTNITKRDISNTLKKTLNLNNPLNIDDVDGIQENLANSLSQENLANCADQVKQNNSIDVAGAVVDGNVIIDNVKQEIIIDSTLNCSFNQTVLNEMSEKVINNIEKIYQQIHDQIVEEETIEQAGDLLALGEAGKTILVGAGEAAATAYKGAGEAFNTAADGLGGGMSTAAGGLGDGLSTAAGGVAKGVSGILDTIKIPLMIAAAVAGVGLVIFLIIKMNSSPF